MIETGCVHAWYLLSHSLSPHLIATDDDKICSILCKLEGSSTQSLSQCIGKHEANDDVVSHHRDNPYPVRLNELPDQGHAEVGPGYV